MNKRCFHILGLLRIVLLVVIALGAINWWPDLLVCRLDQGTVDVLLASYQWLQFPVSVVSPDLPASKKLCGFSSAQIMRCNQEVVQAMCLC